MLVAGRRAELAEVGRLLDGASRGAGGLLVITGPAGSGKTLIAESAAAAARERGFEVLWARPAEGQPGRLAWARLLRDAGAPDGVVTGLIDGDAGPLDLDGAAAHLLSGPLRLIVVDDVDRGGPGATAMLSVVAARCERAAVAVLVTSASPLGPAPELRLGGLTEPELAAGSEIIDLVRVTGDGERERHGMFWRFVALIELGRLDEAESALAAFAHDAAAAGDADATVLATARHAMLAILRGRFDQALRLIEEVEREGRRLGRPDVEAITMTLMGTVALEQGGFGELGAPGKEWWERAPDLVLANAPERPGHLLEAMRRCSRTAGGS